MRLSESRSILIFLGIVSLLYAVYMLYMASLSPGVEGGMDSYQHYLIARYSWKYPVLFLHQWGKPVFTLLASPFAQFGIFGNVIFNLTCQIGTAWLVYFTSLKLKLKYASFSFLAVIFSPIFFDNIISGLTEPLSALLLAAMFYFLVKDKLTMVAVIAGFMPFARSEGFIIMAVVGFYLIAVAKNLKSFLWLLIGSIFMNSLGWIIEGKPLWIFTENPYIRVELEKVNICGSGGISHYIRAIPITFGFVVGAMMSLGAVLIVINRIKRLKELFKPGFMSIWFWVILGSFGLYFGVHTLIWYFGKMGSCGYIRVMTVIVPAAALLSNFSIDRVLKSTALIKLGHKSRWIFVMLMSIATLFMLWEPIWRYANKYPINISKEQALFTEAADWLKTQNIEQRTLYFLYPYLNVLADIDPWDTKKFIEIWGFHFAYAPVGSYVIWDGHFSPNEGKLPLDSLKNHPDFKEIKSFYPEIPFKTLNDYNFEIHIFERVGNSALE